MFRTLPIYLLWLLTLTMGASLVACSDESGPTHLAVVNNVNFKVEIHTNSYGANGVSTRAAGPSADDGNLADTDNEHEVTNATLFLFQNSKGANAPAATPILYTIYVPTFSKEAQNTYTSGIVDTHLSMPTGNYQVLMVCNMGKVQAATLGDLQNMTYNTIANGNLQNPEACRIFAMSSVSNVTINVDGTTNMTTEPNGSLVQFSANVQRLAARIDFSAGQSATWVSQKALSTTTDGDISIDGYQYTIGNAANPDYFYLTGVTPINLNQSGEYVLKRVTEDKTFNTINYLGQEQLGADGNASNYVVDPLTLRKGAMAGIVTTMRYANSYADMMANFAACNQGTNKVSQQVADAAGCYTDATDHLVYKKLTYAQENTIIAGANKQNYVTGLLFTGYYLKAGETKAVRKTYEYFIRHTDPSNTNSDALAMKYGIVRNHVYQMRINGVSSSGLILIQVRDWIPLVAPDIDL